MDKDWGLKEEIFNVNVFIGEAVVVIATGVWAFNDPGWDSLCTFFGGAFALIIHFSLSRKTIVLDSSSKEADRTLLTALQGQLPLDQQMDHWLRDVDLYGRNIHFDYFHRVIEFRLNNERATIFFHNNELDLIFRELLRTIREFEGQSAVYMSPSPGGNNYFEIPRHTDRRAFSRDLDNLEHQRGRELNELATQVYTLFERLYGDGQRRLV